MIRYLDTTPIYSHFNVRFKEIQTNDQIIFSLGFLSKLAEGELASNSTDLDEYIQLAEDSLTRGFKGNIEQLLKSLIDSYN